MKTAPFRLTTSTHRLQVTKSGTDTKMGKSHLNNLRGVRCTECGCICRLLGKVPPETYECRTCGEVFRLTKENAVQMKARVDREKTDESRPNYPTYIRPNWKKLRGER